jgi:hypothetical protein
VAVALSEAWVRNLLSRVSLAAPRGSDVKWAQYDSQEFQPPFPISEMDQRVLGKP